MLCSTCFTRVPISQSLRECSVHKQLHFRVYLCDSGIIRLHYNADCKLSTYAFFDLKMHRRGNRVYGTTLILWATCCSTWYIFDSASGYSSKLLAKLCYRCYIINVRRRKKEVLRYIASIIREHAAWFQIHQRSSQPQMQKRQRKERYCWSI